MGLELDIARERRRQRTTLAIAAAAGAAAACAACALLGLSGWFITGAALAGASGAASAFNYLLPGAAIRLFAIARTLGRYGERLESHRAALKALAALRPRIFLQLARQAPERAFAVSAGEGAANMVQDVDAVEIRFIREPARWAALACAGLAVGLAAMAGAACAAVLAGALIVQVIASLWIARVTASDNGVQLQQGMGRQKDAMAAVLAARAELQAYGLIDWAVDHVEAHAARLDRERLKRLRADGWQSALAAAGQGCAVVAVLCLARHAPPPLMALAGLAAGAGMESAAALARAFQQDSAAREAIRRIDAATGHGAAKPIEALARNARAMDWTALPLSLQAGERLGISGPSGCGKTTLVEQLLGLRSVDGPTTLRVEGLSDDGDRRALFAYAPQTAMLLAGTIRENLALADPAADEDRLWDALRDAGLDRRVRRAPDGLDAWVGDSGERLSGGERRRLALARALLRPAPWLVLDEPTEGLDAETESLVLERLDQRLGRTAQGLVLISHRPAPLRLCGRRLLGPEFGEAHAAA
jgi:ATP-binding cassette subfamily C protein CydC